jgi:hypothetical protein
MPFREGPTFLELIGREVIRLLQPLIERLRQQDAGRWSSSVARSPATSLALLLLSFLAVSLASHGYQATRWILSMPYPDPSGLVLISEVGVLPGQRMAVSPGLLEYWGPRVTKLSGVAGYRWDDDGSAYVTGGFFELLGGPPRGFVPRAIRTWRAVSQHDRASLGVIGRLKPGATMVDAKDELRELEENYRQNRRQYPFPRADITSLVTRLRQPFVTYGLICGLSILAPMIAIGVGIVAEARRGNRIRVRYWTYFTTKAVFFPLTLFVAICEFTPVTSLRIVGDASFAGEPFMAWLLIVVCICWIRWCLIDQYGRCRVCLRRLKLPVTVGVLGAVILDTAGTELACSEGHGALYIPEESSDYVVTGGWSDLLP